MISVEGNPNIKRCRYGHYYEIKKHIECPYCKDDYKRRNNTIRVNTYRNNMNGQEERTEIIFMDR